MLRHSTFFVGTLALFIAACVYSCNDHIAEAMMALAAANLWVYIDERWK